MGSVVAFDLIAAGREAVVYDNLSSGHVRAAPNGALLVRGDLSNRDLLTSVIREHWENRARLQAPTFPWLT